MKRRNADCGKLRRPIKRNKITEGMYGSNTLLYIKFLVLWAIVITADFMLEFRFEFLWPFWLLLRSVHDSFKYKGLAFSVLFVCIAITSDLVCLFFIPVHWLFFAASTYVWVQYVWHTDKGICLPTIILWMLFVYLEAAIRWKDSRHMPHLDLCRPFAAHCIGYPVVTLGFGFKSYVGYRMRQRKQREVAKENEFYMQLLQQALPQDETQETGLTTTSSEQQTTGQHDIQQKELSPVTAISVNNNNNNSTNNKNNAQTNSKHNNNNSSNNSNLFNNSNGHMMMTTVHQTVMPQNVTNGVNHLHNNNSHKNNNHRRSLDKESSQISNSNFLIISNSKLTDLPSNMPLQNAGAPTIAVNSLSPSSSSSIKNSHTTNSSNSSSSNTQSSNHRDTISCHATSGQHKKYEHDSIKHNGDIKSNESHHHIHHQHHNGHCITEHNRKNHQNGSILNYDVHEVNDIQQMPIVPILHPIETVEKHKSSGRKNRVRQKNNVDGVSSLNSSTSKENQQQQQDSGAIQQQYVSQYQQTMPQICESCVRLENEAKKMKQDINHLKQIENELRQKIDSSVNYKNCLQVKQREIDDLEKRLQDVTNLRQLDRQNALNSDRRLTEERRQKQSLESQLNNERKQRKLTEERAVRSECGDLCKMKKQQLEMECNKWRRDYGVMEDAKNNFEHQNRNYEQELQKFKTEIRNREQQQGTEVLMSALNAMQLKNSTLEKNLSDETRVKLDLFSALGEAKRQVEISDNHARIKEKEVNDLQTKIAQLLAVMPCHDNLCIGNPSSNTSSILRVNDTPPLLQQQSNQQSQQQQQGCNGPSSPMSQLGLSVSPLLGQLSSLGVLTSTPPPHPPQISISSTSSSSSMSSSGVVVNGQQVQMQNSSGSNLDPNATAYTPKNNGSQLQVGGTEA